MSQKKISLYNISENMRALGDQLTMNHGEMSEVEETLLGQLEDQLKSKTDGVIDWIKELTNHVSEIDSRIKELQTLKKTKTNELNAFKSYVVVSMNMMKSEKVIGSFGFITLRKATQKTKIIDQDKIPLQFIESKTTESIQVARITEALKNGQKISGAILEFGERSLLIK